MSIAARSSDFRPLGVAGSDHEPAVDPSGRPARLLPADRADSSAPTPTPFRALASDAAFVLRLIRATDRFDQAWSDSSFERTVEAVRGHLAPIGSRHGLAGSFDREAFRRVHDHGQSTAGSESGIPTESPWAVRVGYAIRWLELGDGATRPPWSALRMSRGTQLRLVDRRRRPPRSRRRRR